MLLLSLSASCVTPFLVFLAFAQSLSLTLFLGLLCSLFLFPQLKPVFMCMCTQRVCVRLYLKVKHLVAIRVNHPSFLQLPVTYRLTQTHTTQTKGRTLQHSRQLWEDTRTGREWTKWQDEEMEGSERPREKNDGENEGENKVGKKVGVCETGCHTVKR